MWHRGDKQPMVVERRVELHDFPEVARAAREDRQSVCRLARTLCDEGHDALNIAVEAGARLAGQCACTVSGDLAEPWLDVGLAVLIGTRVEVKAQDRRLLARFKRG